MSDLLAKEIRCLAPKMTKLEHFQAKEQVSYDTFITINIQSSILTSEIMNPG